MNEPTPTLSEELDRAQRRLDEILRRIAERVEALPDNPRVRRVSANAFTLSASDLGSNWSPFYHDFKAQYRAVADAIRGGNVATSTARLRAIISSRSVGNSAGRFARTLHPEVVAHLKRLLDGGAE